MFKIIYLAFICGASAIMLNEDQLWKDFKLQFNKTYLDRTDESIRKLLFLETCKKIETHNIKFEKGLTTYKQGINFYSDWTWNEFQDQMLMKPTSPNLFLPNQNLDDTFEVLSEDVVDWRPFMNPVKNQGQCGSSVIFSVIGAIEAMWNIGKMILEECKSCKTAFLNLQLETTNWCFLRK